MEKNENIPKEEKCSTSGLILFQIYLIFKLKNSFEYFWSRHQTRHSRPCCCHILIYSHKWHHIYFNTQVLQSLVTKVVDGNTTDFSFRLNYVN